MKSETQLAQPPQTAAPTAIFKRHPVWMTLALLLIIAVAAFLYYRHIRQPLTLTGAIVVQDTDVRKQLPIAGVEVSLKSGLARGTATSDASGFFSLRLFKKVRRGEQIVL